MKSIRQTEKKDELKPAGRHTASLKNLLAFADRALMPEGEFRLAMAEKETLQRYWFNSEKNCLLGIVLQLSVWPWCVALQEWDLATGEVRQIAKLREVDDFYCALLLQDYAIIVNGLRNKTFLLYNSATGEFLQERHWSILYPDITQIYIFNFPVRKLDEHTVFFVFLSRYLALGDDPEVNGEIRSLRLITWDLRADKITTRILHNENAWFETNRTTDHMSSGSNNHYLSFEEFDNGNKIAVHDERLGTTEILDSRTLETLQRFNGRFIGETRGKILFRGEQFAMRPNKYDPNEEEKVIVSSTKPSVAMLEELTESLQESKKFPEIDVPDCGDEATTMRALNQNEFLPYNRFSDETTVLLDDDLQTIYRHDKNKVRSYVGRPLQQLSIFGIDKDGRYRGTIRLAPTPALSEEFLFAHTQLPNSLCRMVKDYVASDFDEPPDEQDAITAEDVKEFAALLLHLIEHIPISKRGKSSLWWVEKEKEFLHHNKEEMRIQLQQLLSDSQQQTAFPVQKLYDLLNEYILPLLRLNKEDHRNDHVYIVKLKKFFMFDKISQIKLPDAEFFDTIKAEYLVPLVIHLDKKFKQQAENKWHTNS